MFDAASPSEAEGVTVGGSGNVAPATAAAGVGYDGRLDIRFDAAGGRTETRHLYQSAPCRALFPGRPSDLPRQMVQLNIAGGLVGGDRIATTIAVDSGARVFATTQAAEKVYRSAGHPVRLQTSLSAAGDAWLEWMPHPTILFDGAQLDRSLDADLSPDATLLAGEMLILGRTAYGEALATGTLRDRWAVRIGGRTVWRERTAVADWLGAADNPARFAGVRAVATLLLAGPQVESALALIREAGGVEDGRFGATQLGPMVLARWLGADAALLQAAWRRTWGAVRNGLAGYPPDLPSIWRS